MRTETRINIVSYTPARVIAKAIFVLAIVFSFTAYQCLATTYYNKSSGTGALQTLANWGTNTDGSGTAPSNFTTSGNVYNLYNGSTATITAAWVITGVTLNVGNGSAAMNLTIPSSFSLTGTGVVSVGANATLTVQNATNPTLGTLDTNSTVNYNGTAAQTIAAATYGNLTLSGTRSATPAITLASGTITVKGDFIVSYTGAVSFTTTGNTFVYGDVTGGSVVGGITYGTLTFSNTSGVNTAGGTVTANTALTTTAGGTLEMGTNALAGTLTTITNNGTIQTENTSTAPFTTGKTWGGSGTVRYNVTTGGQTIMAGTYNCSLVLANTSGTNTASGVLTINGSLTIPAGGTLNMSSFAIAGTPSSVTNNGTITTSATTNPALPAGQNWGGSSSTITFARATGGQDVPAGTYYNLTFSNTSGTQTAVGALTVNGAFTVTSGGTVAMGAFQLLGTLTPTLNGSLTTNCTSNPAIPSGLTWTGTTGALTYGLATGGQFIPAGTYKTLKFSNTIGTNTATGNLTVNTAITTSSAGGTLDMGVYTLGGTLTTFTNTGTIKTQSLSTTPLPANLTVAGTVNYYAATGGQTIAPETSFKTLILSNSSGTNTAAGLLTVNTALTTTAGGTLDMTAAYRLAGTPTTITNNGTIKTSVPTSVSTTPILSGKNWGGTIIYAATAGAQTVLAGTYNALTIGNSSGTNTASGTLMVNGTLTTTTGGTLDMSTFAMTGTVTPTNNGTIKTSSIVNPPFPTGKNWTGTTGAVYFALATGAQSIPAGTYGTLKLGNTSGTNTALGALVVNTSLITTAGGTMAMGTNQLSGTAAPLNNGTITTSSTANPAILAGQDWTTGTGSVIFSLLTGGQFVPQGIYRTLTMSNTSGTNTVVVGDVTVNGTMTIAVGGTFDLGTLYELAGTATFTNNGTIKTAEPTTTGFAPLPAGITWGGTINYYATTGGQTVVGGTYNNLLFSNTSGTNTAIGNITVNSGTMTTTAGGTLYMGTNNILSGTGTFTNNGTIQTGVPASTSATPIPSGKTWAGTIYYSDSAGAQTVVSETAYNNLIVNSAGDTSISAANLIVNGTLNIPAGSIFSMGAFTLSGTLSSITGTGLIQTANTSSTPVSTGKIWSPTIEYNNASGSQTVVSGNYNGGLTNSNTSGTNTIVSAGTVSITGNLTLNNGSVLNDNGVNLSLNGNIAGTGGTHTGTGSITMTGSGGTISGVTLGNLKLNNAGGFSTTDNVNIAGVLTLTSGRLDIGTDTLAFGASGTVAGTFSSSNMIIANGGGMVTTSNAAGTYLFPIGDNTPSYTPVSLTFTSGSAGPGAFAGVNVTKAKHPQNANTTNYLNRYWSFVVSGVTGPVYNISATYVTGDVTGTEASISMGEYPGTLPWIKYGATNTSTHTLTATGVTDQAADYSGITTANPTVSISPSSTAICNGGSVGLTATGGGNPTLSYSWAPSTGLSATTGAIVTASPTTTGTVTSVYVYTVTITDGNGIIGSGISTVTVNPTPVITGTTNICVGLTSALSSTLGGTWSSSNTAKATVGSATGIITGIATGTANITFIPTTGCIVVTPVTVNAVPTTITGVTNVCAGSSVTLSESIAGGAWSSSDTTIATVVAGGAVTGVASGTATISYISGAACYVTDAVTIGPILPITGTLNACVALTTSLSDATTGGTWSSSNTAKATIGSSTGIVTGVSSGTATITYSIGSGCLRTNTITINAVPAAITGTANVCAGLTTTLAESVAGGTWSSSNTAYAIVGSTGIVTGVAAGSPTISYISGSGCFVTDAVTVNPLPSAITGTTNVCVASTTTLTDGGSGTWTSSNTSYATIGSSSGIVTGVGNGVPTITYTLPTGCLTAMPITVNPLPATITGTTNICVPATATLTDAGGGIWTSSNTAYATIGTSSGIVTAVAAGVPTITYTLSTGCIATKAISINPIPAAITGTTNVCVSSGITLTDAGGGTWTSSNTSFATIGSSSGVVTSVATGVPVITYNLNGCLATKSITVNPLPAAITGTTNVCVSSTINLTDAGGGTWTSSNTSFATIGSTGIVSGVATGVPTITYTLSTGCIATKIVSVNPLPASITGALVICADGGSTLADATTGGTWSSSDITNVAIGSSSGIASAVSSGPSVITYQLSTGCKTTTTMTVNDVPSSILGAVDTCQGLTTLLSDSTSGGLWTSSNTSIATIGSSSGVTVGVGAGTAIISYTLPSTGCKITAGFPVDPIPMPITGTLSVCIGSITNLNDTTTGGIWTSSNTGAATIDSVTGDVTAIATGTSVINYTLSGTGCASISTVTINAVPSLSSASNNGPICSGTTLTLTANTPVNVATYAWAGPVAITSSASASASVPSSTTAATGTYTVTVSNSTGIGCVNTYTTTATVNAAPTAAPTSNGPICLGGTVTLTANPGGGTSVYAWSGSNISSTTAQNPTATPTTTGTYSLTVTNGTSNPGCTAAYTTTVSVNAVPTAAPTNSGTICNASTVTLNANPAAGASAYTWTGSNLSSTTAQNPTATPSVTTTYSLTVTNGSGSGCTPSTVYTTTVTVRPTGYWLGATNRNWSDGTNWCGGVPTISTNTLIPTGSAYMPFISSGTAYTNNVTIQSGETLTDSNAILQIAGAISNSGTLTATKGTIAMVGTSAQTIPASTFSGNLINNLTINNTAGVTLGGALSISGIVLAGSGALSSGGNLTLLSTATQTALVDGSGAGSITGNVNMQCYIDTSYGYRYLSSPFTAATLSQLSSYLTLHDTIFPTVYKYLENDSTNGYVVDTARADTFKVMNGYACNFGTSFNAKTVSLTGVVNNGSLSATLFNHNKTYTLGYNLIGNPYPSPIDWNASSGWTKTNIDNALYYFNTSDTNRYTGTYSSYVSGVSSDGRSTNIIASMQGFFIHVSNGTYPVTGTLSLTNAVRVNNLSPVFHRESATSGRSLLRLSAGFNDDGSHADPTVVYFDDSATNVFSSNLDALKLMNTDNNVPSLYSVAQDNNKLSINAFLPSVDSTDLIPLGLQTAISGYITFNASNIENIPAGMHMYLYDTKVGVAQDITANPKYRLYLSSGTYENRFFIVFTTKDKVNIPGYNGELNAYTNGKDIFVYLTTGTGHVIITDILGRVVTKQDISSNGYHEIDLDVAPGVYFATMYSDMGKQTKKLFIGK